MLAPIAYMTCDVAIRVLPVPAANGIAKALARAAFALRLPARRRLEANLSRLLDAGTVDASPEDGRPRSSRSKGGSRAATRSQAAVPTAAVRARALEAFEHFALSFADFLRLGHMRCEILPGPVEVRGAEHLAAAATSGRGVIVLSAHVGSWERGAAYLAALGRRVHVATRPHPSRWVEAFFARRRSRWGVRRLGGRPLWLAASRALRRREWIALMGDRPAPGLGGSLCAWAAALSRRTGSLVLPAVMLRLGGGRYAACFEPPLTPAQARDGGYRDAMRRCLERAPGQWCAFEPLPEGLA